MCSDSPRPDSTRVLRRPMRINAQPASRDGAITVTDAARTRMAKPNRDMLSTVNCRESRGHPVAPGRDLVRQSRGRPGRRHRPTRSPTAASAIQSPINPALALARPFQVRGGEGRPNLWVTQDGARQARAHSREIAGDCWQTIAPPPQKPCPARISTKRRHQRAL